MYIYIKWGVLHFILFNVTVINQNSHALTDPCPSKRVQWSKMPKYEGYFTADSDLDILYDVWRFSDCRDQCERRPMCGAIKFSEERGICVLSDGALKMDKNAGMYQGYPGWDYHSFTCEEGMCCVYFVIWKLILSGGVLQKKSQPVIIGQLLKRCHACEIVNNIIQICYYFVCLSG